MTELLRQAFDKAAALPQAQQDALAARLLEEMKELADARIWAEKLAGSDSLLDRLAAEALEEYLLGKTRPLEELLDEPL